MRKTLTQKQETFCLKYFELGNASEAAIIAGYSPKTVAVIASENLTKPKIIERIQALRQAAEDASVANFLERQQVLTEIARARLPDYVTCGPDGDLISVGPESPHTAAFQEITSRTEFDKDGAGGAVTTKLKLHSPIQAIDILNKMDKVYEGEGGVTISNQILNINVISDRGRKATERIAEGERTE